MPWQYGTSAMGIQETRAEGVDLNLRLGYSTDQLGSLKLGLQFSRVINAQFSMFSLNDGTPLRWLPAEPFNTAQMNLDWSRGDFSGGIQGYYRDHVELGDYSDFSGVSGQRRPMQA